MVGVELLQQVLELMAWVVDLEVLQTQLIKVAKVETVLYF
jgi:hypothetical protein